MTLVALLRHGPTAASRAHRLQGRGDQGLDAEGRAQVRGWYLPPEMTALDWRVSPLARARETAEILGLAAAIEPRLMEMDWGRWEGRGVAELRAEGGADFAAEEARGLDLAPPGGESPRAVQKRLAPLLAEIAESGRATGAITHKGVIRAVLALATGWDMTGPPPAKLAWDALHLFALDAAGRPRIERLNLRLAAR